MATPHRTAPKIAELSPLPEPLRAAIRAGIREGFALALADIRAEQITKPRRPRPRTSHAASGSI